MNLKKKYTLLSFGFILLIWIAYQFAFSKTLNLNSTFNSLKQQDELFNSISENINLLKQQEIYYNSILNKYQISSESSFQNNLLKIINEIAEMNKMKVISFKDPHIFNLNNVKQETYSFTIEGDFNSIIKLMYSLEQHHKFGKIISVSFEKKKNYKNFTESLQCTIFLQRVLQETEE
jgi:hypothetical protein